MQRLLLRGGVIIAGLAAWFATQKMIGARGFPADGAIHDGVHDATMKIHAALLANPIWADRLLIVSSLAIDIVGVWLLAAALFGRSMRPFYELLLLFALRQICQGLTALPAPAGMIWRDPGFPSLLVTYGTTTDLFFSGHTAIAVLGGIELWRTGRPWAKVIGVLFPIFEASTVLLLRAHYFMDVFTGVLAAVLVALWGRRFMTERA